jgi:hypothetical protein
MLSHFKKKGIMITVALAVIFLVAIPAVSASPKVGSVTVTPQSQDVTAGNTVTYTVTVTRGSGSGSSGAFTADLSITGLPEGASFSPGQVTLGSKDSFKDVTVTATIPKSAAGPYYDLTVTATRTDNSNDKASSETTRLYVSPFVVPEYSLGALAALGVCFGGFFLFKKRSSFPHFKGI